MILINKRALLLASLAACWMPGFFWPAEAATSSLSSAEIGHPAAGVGDEPSSSNGVTGDAPRGSSVAPAYIQPAAAQNSQGTVEAPAPPAPSGQLAEIIVTAQKRSERLSDVPISVNAISGDQLDKQGINSTADLQKIVPGFTFAPASTGAPIYTLRGVGFYANSIAVAPAVSVYIDQVPLPFSRMAEGASLDLERVEVLKGPQGTLFGQNSTGGAINYIAGKPTSTYQGEGELTYGRFNEVDLGGFLSGPVSDDVALRLAVRSENSDGWQQNYVQALNVASNRPNGARDFQEGRIIADWTPSNKLAWEFTLSGWKDQSDDQANQKIAYAPLIPLNAGGFAGSASYPNLQADLQAYPSSPRKDTAAGFDPGVSLRRNDDFELASARGDWQAAPRVTLTSITSYANLKVNDPVDLDGTELPDNYVIAGGRITSVTQELRGAGTALSDDQLKWLVGANFEYDQTHEVFNTNDNGTNSGFAGVRFSTFDEQNNQNIKTEAAFANIDYAVLPKLNLQAAARYTARQDHFTGCLADTGLSSGIGPAFAALSSLLTGSAVTVTPGSCVTLGADNKPDGYVDRTLDENNVSYRGGISWKATPDLLAYANVTKGYKAGAFDTLPAIRPDQDSPVKQESVLAYEAGIKTFLFEHRVAIDGAAFYYDYRNKQTEGFVNTGFPFGLLEALVNIPKSRVEGLEFDTRVSPLVGLTLSFGATYLKTQVEDDFIIAAPLGGLADIKGEPFPNTPKWQMNADAEYNFPLTNGFDAFVGTSATYHSRGIAAFGGGSLFDIAGYTLIDLRAGIEPSQGRWRLELWGRNITDRYYWNTVERDQDTLTRTTGMPLTYGVTVRVKF